MSGWNNDPNTNIQYARVGSTNSTNGLTIRDNINTIVFEVYNQNLNIKIEN
jgi:hypothetical protein